MPSQPLQIGSAAPSFALPDHNDTLVRLSDLAGKWVVLYFYPKDDTPGCTTEACEFTDSIAEFEGMDAEVLGCSPDAPASHRKFIAKHSLKFRLLSDPGHETLAAYGAWGEKKMYGRSTQGVIRSTVIIDPAGRVAAHWPTVKAAGHAAAVRDKLTTLRR